MSELSLPQYSCHKVVRAAKILEIVHDAEWHLRLEGGYVVHVDDVWMGRHEPIIGQVYVVYADGYASCSPAAPFEAGYQRLPEARNVGSRTPSDAELEGRFRYHPPTTDDQRLRHTLVSEKTLELAKLLRDICPDGRDLSLALTYLEEVRMRGNAAIATNHAALPA